MKNEGLEKALEETWRNKERFYEDTKGLPVLEIVREIENKYKVQNTEPNRDVSDILPYCGIGGTEK
ncbi:MAG: hypothetical protein LBC59_02545 [Chitinispirillales bacterium]|nr:hypothetical protein [Chitinispirillales bacterium]